MRIGINCCSFLKKEYTGIGRYAYNLVKSLAALDAKNEYRLYVRRDLFDRKRRCPPFPAGNFKIKTDFFKVGPAKILKDVDFYHSPSLDFVDIHYAKVVVTIHDLIHKVFPEVHSLAAREVIEKQLKNIVQRADKIICCSQSTIDDLKRYYDVDEDKVRLIYQGVDKEVFYPVTHEERRKAEGAIQARGVKGPYLLFVGTLEPRKNLKNIIKAFGMLKDNKIFSGQLVVVGGRGWMMDDLDGWLKESNVRDSCIFTGYLTDEELRYFYNMCEVFVYPSFYEGFGFPIIEAMSCGAVVVTSDVSSCPEIASQGALTVDPRRPAQIANAIAAVVKDKDFKEDLRLKGIERAKVFSFRSTAEQTLEVYESLGAGSKM